jgi:thioredoxin-related protein
MTFYTKILNILLPLLFAFVVVGRSQSTQSSENLKLLIFQGSDWCSKCIKLEKSILSDTMFTNYLSENHIELQLIDFPQRKKQDIETKERNKSIAEKHGFDGLFPTILLVNIDSEKKTKIIFNSQKTSEFIGEIEEKIQAIQ